MTGCTARVESTGLGHAHAPTLGVGTDGDSKIKIRADLGRTVLAHPGAASTRGDLERLTGVGSGKERGNT